MRRTHLVIKPSLIIAICLGTIGPLWSAGCCTPLKLSSVAVAPCPQQRDWWCWAATTEQISALYGHRVDQCSSAGFVHGTPPDCCTGCTGNCPCWGSGWGASIADMSNNWKHWNFTFTYVSSSLAWDELRRTLSTQPFCRRSPVQAIWWWTGGGGHVVTLYGYVEVGGQKYVSYLNPWPPSCSTNNKQCSSVSPAGDDVVSTFDAFVSDGSHSWGDSFYAFKHKGS
ncbi:MAG TPA: hypothetical protein VGK32_15710 [Vicinamibacterales bacterium]